MQLYQLPCTDVEECYFSESEILKGNNATAVSSLSYTHCCYSALKKLVWPACLFVCSSLIREFIYTADTDVYSLLVERFKKRCYVQHLIWCERNNTLHTGKVHRQLGTKESNDLILKKCHRSKAWSRKVYRPMIE